MKKHEELQKDGHDPIIREPLVNVSATSVGTKAGNYLKRFVYLTSLAGIGIFFNGCMAGYVASEPAYVEYDRPQRPSDAHIWINGNWGYNRQSHVYVQKTGYWQQPTRGQTYVSGQWQTTPRGHRWSRGHWQKQGRNR